MADAVRRDTLPLYRDTDWRYTWPLTDNAGQPWVWQPSDTIAGQIRVATGGALLHTWTRGNADVITADGALTLIIEASVSASWTTNLAVADVEVTRPGNAVGERKHRPIRVVLNVEHDITV